MGTGRGIGHRARQAILNLKLKCWVARVETHTPGLWAHSFRLWLDASGRVGRIVIAFCF